MCVYNHRHVTYAIKTSAPVRTGEKLHNLGASIWSPVGFSTSFSQDLASDGQQGDSLLIKQAGNGLHEKLIRVLMKAN